MNETVRLYTEKETGCTVAATLAGGLYHVLYENGTVNVISQDVFNAEFKKVEG